MTTFIGVDPGKSGGVAWIIDGRPGAEGFNGLTERDTWEVFQDLRRNGPAVAVLELVHSSPQMGVVSAFTFGSSYGALRMALIAAGISFCTVTPAKWQGALGCHSKGDKNVTKAKAQEVFPSMRVNHAIADALLLAEYARRMTR